MTMKKIQRYLFLLVSLLTTTAWADNYQIIELKTAGLGSGTLTADYAVETDIAYDATVTLTATPGDGCFLDKIEIEYVMDLGGAEGRENRAPSIFTVGQTINRNSNYKDDRYGGAYSFKMPAYNVIIIAYFVTSLPLDNSNTTFGISGSGIYDKTTRNLVVTYNGDTQLSQGTDYTITGMTFEGASTSGDYTIKNAGTYQVTIQGIGIYSGTVTSGDLSIAQKSLTITAVAKQKIFGSDDPALTYNQSGLYNGDAITGALIRGVGENAGTYDITQGSLTAGSNYAISFTGATFTINPKNITTSADVTLSGESFEYDGNTHTPSLTIKDGSTTLTGGGNDYSYTTTPTYTAVVDNISPDIYHINITFTNNYTGSKTVSYQIRPQINLATTHQWSTLFETKVNMSVPANAGFEVYTFWQINGNIIQLDRRYYIKKDTPMLLYCENGGTFYPELVESNTAGLSSISSNSAFKGVSSAADVTTLPTSTDYEIWILKDDRFVRTKSGLIPAGKCYLEMLKSSFSEPSLTLSREGDDDDGTTSIVSIENGKLKMENDKYYDLNGRRVLYPRKGVYIMNGKKIIIK